MITNTANSTQNQIWHNLSVNQLCFFLPVEGVPITGATVHQPEVPAPRYIKSKNEQLDWVFFTHQNMYWLKM